VSGPCGRSLARAAFERIGPGKCNAAIRHPDDFPRVDLAVATQAGPGACYVCAPGHRVATMPEVGARALLVEGRWETILASESGPAAGAEGAVEDVKGRAKEAAGAVTGNESLKQEGQAQQDKAAAQRDGQGSRG
jgi:uncharacterized protein YjbJ (UPF0337 family)